MARRDWTEDALVQQPAIETLKSMGWSHTRAFDTEFKDGISKLGRSSFHTAILVKDLREALIRLNPTAPEKVIDDAISQLTQHDARHTLIQRNEQRYDLLKQGVQVDGLDAQNRPMTYMLKVIDFQNIANNSYHIVDELWIANSLNERKRPDLLAYVNGLPLVFFEFKNTHVSKDYAFKGNLSDYKDKIAHLFDYNAIVVLANGFEASYGSITAPLDQFKQWKRNFESDPEPDPTRNQLPVLLAGLMQPKTLLDMIENFILFENGAQGVHKIVARNHQFLGVNRVIERLTSSDPLIQAEVQAGRLGVFWHTQGSGKSYSMVFLTEKILRTISSDYSFILVTDRTELDDQISKTYADCGKASRQTDQMVSGLQLKQKLSSGNQPYIFTMVHKYNQSVKTAYSERANIIVISDEAHRSQYGDLANNMRAALPNAKFLGFTGTPLMSTPEDQTTKEWFGDYVSVYNFQRAVADGATVPLVYENHGAKLNLIPDSDLNERVLERIEQARKNGKSEEALEKLLRAAKSDYVMLTAPKRLDVIAEDIVNHYANRWLAVENQNSKALLVCLDRVTCLKMHVLIVEKWLALIALKQVKLDKEKSDLPSYDSHVIELESHLNWMKETEFCVVVSGEQNELSEIKLHKDHNGNPLDMKSHRENIQKRELDQEFKNDKNPRFVIVCAMWLTGFDVKSLATLYIDKPMQGHTLMQAIARANRVGGGKKHGLIVDYNGMLQSLRKALSVFAVGQPSAGQKEVDPLLDSEVPFGEYETALDEAFDYARQLGAPIDELVLAVSKDRAQLLRDCQNALSHSKETRATFMARYRDIEQRYNNLLPSTDVIPSEPSLHALRAIYRQFTSKDPTESILPELQSIQNLVNANIAVYGKVPSEAGKKYHLTDIDFDRLRLEFVQTQHKATKILELQDRIESALQRLIAQNDKRYNFMETYQGIVENNNNDSSDVNIQKTFDELMKIHEALTEEEKRYVKEGFESDYELALFDKLDKPQLAKKEREELKRFAHELLQKIQQRAQELQDWGAQTSSKADIKNLILGEIFINKLIPESHFPYPERERYADELFQYVMGHALPKQGGEGFQSSIH
jgi:type I restriction enzyme R subunit